VGFVGSCQFLMAMSWSKEFFQKLDVRSSKNIRSKLFFWGVGDKSIISSFANVLLEVDIDVVMSQRCHGWHVGVCICCIYNSYNSIYVCQVLFWETWNNGNESYYPKSMLLRGAISFPLFQDSENNPAGMVQ
jgi:hypothetical protein